MSKARNSGHLNEAALDDIRLALNQGHSLGLTAVGVRCTQNKPGRPAGKLKQHDDAKDQTGFGF